MTYSPQDYDEAYDDADLPKGGDLPPGTYQAYVERAQIRDGFDDHPQLSLQCRVLTEEYQGRVLFINNTFNPDLIKYLKQTLNRLEVGSIKPSELLATPEPGQPNKALATLLDRVVEIAVVRSKKNPAYTNNYINRLVMEQVESKHEAPPIDDADLPF